MLQEEEARAKEQKRLEARRLAEEAKRFNEMGIRRKEKLVSVTQVRIRTIS